MNRKKAIKCIQLTIQCKEPVLRVPFFYERKVGSK